MRLVIGSLATGLSVTAYLSWRDLEQKAALHRAWELVRNGYVDVRGVTPQMKEKAWNQLSCILRESWRNSVHPEADPNDSASWNWTGASSTSQRYTSLAISKIEGQPSLFEHPEVQSTLIAYLDPDFSGKLALIN